MLCFGSFGDTTQLDEAFNRVATEAGEKLGVAGAAAGGLGTKLEAAGAQGTAAGKSLADAFQLLPPVIAASDSQLEAMAFALRNVEVAGVEAGEKTALAMVSANEKLRVTTHALEI